jgi:hypothetical protein
VDDVDMLDDRDEMMRCDKSDMGTILQKREKDSLTQGISRVYGEI